MKLRFLLAATALLSALAPAARGTVLVYDGFHPADYNNVPADGNNQVNTTFTAGHTWTMTGEGLFGDFGEGHSWIIDTASVEGLEGQGGIPLGCVMSADGTSATLSSDAAAAPAGTYANAKVKLTLVDDGTGVGGLEIPITFVVEE